MELEVGDIVMCTVQRIAGTVVFVNIENGPEANIILSEIAPGRIRNLREYVVPKKRIVCKVLRLSNGRVDLSLRRVSPSEKKKILEEYKQEKSYQQILKSILKEKSKEIIEKITEEQRLLDFIEEIKENPKKLEDFVGKTDSKKILEIVNSQKKRTVEIKKEFSMKSEDEDGLNIIKNILAEIKNAKVDYISAGKYSLKSQGEDLKSVDKKLQKVLEELDSASKKAKVEFSLK